MAYRLVEVLEYGWDLAIRCTACGAHETRSVDHFLGPWRKYLNADVQELTKRLRCECKAQACVSSIMGGRYAHFGMLHDAVNGRARWIRKALSEAGLDPAAYGYPTLTEAQNAKSPPSG